MGTKPRDRTGGDVLLDVVREWGSECIFCCPGSTEVPILDALVGREGGPRFILAPHEGVAVSAAEGYARTAGRPGVVSLHANVGLANGVSQVYGAQVSSQPLVVMNVVKQRSILSHGAFTTARDHQEMIKQYTKWDWLTLRPEELREDLHEAFRMATQPPLGPVYLALPQDMLEQPAAPESVYPARAAGVSYHSRPSAEDMRAAAEILAQCDYPLIIAGAGVVPGEGFALIQRLAELLGAGVCCESGAMSDLNTFPTGHPQFVGPFSPTHPALAEADTIFAAGARLFVEFAPPDRSWVPAGTRLVHLHEDVGRIGRLYPATVGLCGGTAQGLADLIAAVTPLLAGRDLLVELRRKRTERFRQIRQEALRREEASIASARPIKVARVARALSSFVDENTSVVVDAATSNDVFMEHMDRPREFSYHASTGGSLGWGMGAAIGVQFAAPDRRVICVVGDGTFHFGPAALWMAAKHSLPIVFIVINNGMYAAVKKGLIRYAGRAVEAGVFPATDVTGVDFVRVAEGYGLVAERLTEPDELEPAVERALKRRGPSLLDVTTDPGDVGRL